MVLAWAIEAQPHNPYLIRREYAVDGAGHNSFTDLSILRDLLGDDFPPGQDLGTIYGSTILAIEMAFLDAFFGQVLKSQNGTLLNWQGLEQWPEVTLVR